MTKIYPDVPHIPPPYLSYAPKVPRRVLHWAIVRGVAAMWQHLREDGRAIPRRAWWTWAGILLGGLVACAGLCVVITKVAESRVDRGLQTWDERWLLTVAEHGPMSFPDAILAESPGNLAYLIPLTLVVAVLAIRVR